MCLLIAKPSGVGYGKISQAIRNGATSNDHGFGFALKRAGSCVITVKKNFDTAEEMITELERLKVEVHDELMVHLRYATRGKRNHANAHPYVVSRAAEFFNVVDATTRHPVMGHNGCLSNYGTSEISDSYDFALKVMAHPVTLGLINTNPEGFFENPKIKGILSWSKICVMYPHRAMFWHGTREIFEGVFYSNGGYHGHGFEKESPAQTNLNTEPSNTPDLKTAKIINVSKIEAVNNVSVLHGLYYIHPRTKVLSVNSSGNQSIITLDTPKISVDDPHVAISELKEYLGNCPTTLDLHGYDKMSLEGIENLLRKLCNLRMSNKTWAHSTFFLSNIFYIIDGIKLLQKHAMEHYPTEATPEFFRIAGVREADLITKEVSDMQKITSQNIMDVLNNPDKYILICSNAIVKYCKAGEKYHIDRVNKSETWSTLQIVETTDRTEKYITANQLLEHFFALDDKEAVAASKACTVTDPKMRQAADLMN